MLLNFGVSGAMLGFFVIYLNKITADHKEERAQWKEEARDMFNRFNTSLEKNTDAINELTNEIIKQAHGR